jgi:hypothetical protein
MEVMMTWRRFYVRVPEHEINPMRRVKHADETVAIAGGFFICPPGVGYIQEPDGTFEVRALAPSYVETVRSMLTEHEGLTIEREEVVDS